MSRQVKATGPMREPRVGDTIHAFPTALSLWEGAPRTYLGKIVSVNRRHRHYTVAFDVAGQIIRETYKFDDGVMYH